MLVYNVFFAHDDFFDGHVFYDTFHDVFQDVLGAWYEQNLDGEVVENEVLKRLSEVSKLKTSIQNDIEVLELGPGI